MKRQNGVCQRIGHILVCEKAPYNARKVLRCTRIFLWMDQWSKTISHWNGIRIPSNTENFVPLLFSGLSNSSSGSDSSTSRNLSRQVSHCSTFSFSSPTASEIKTREREDRTESDISPVTVNYFKLMKARVDPILTKPIKIQHPMKENHRKNGETRCWANGATRCLPTLVVQALKSWSGCMSSEKNWWMVKFQNMESLAPVLLTKYLYSAYSRDVWILVNTMFTLISLKTKIARSTKGLKLQGTVQETQWWSRTSCWKFWWLDNSRSQGPQWQLRISKQSPMCNRGAGLSHSMDPSISVEYKNFTGNRK